MDLNYSATEEAFRQDVRSWLAANIPADLAEKVASYQELGRDDLLRWHRILAAKGWVAPAWPEEWGGTGWGAVERFIFEEECSLAGAPGLVPFGLAMCGPVLIRFASPEIKERFLPRIYNGVDFWCQGYSEPGSGSDLASLKTRAERRGDKYIVNGQKIWTTLGHFADWIFCLVRTDTESRIRQEGISFLLIDMKSPGISVRPLILMDGRHEVNEVFFDNVEVPANQLVHEEGKGWTVAKFLLGHERLNTGRVGASKRELAKLKAWAANRTHAGKPWIEHPRFADKVAELEIDLMALEITNLRFLDQLRGGKPPGAEVSMLKLRGTEIQQRLTELMMEAGGTRAERIRPLDSAQWADEAFDTFAASLGPRYANYRKTSIYAGSNEIQRNIMAKMMLGL